MSASVIVVTDGTIINVFLIVESTKYIKMENVFVKMIMFTIRENVLHAHQTLGFQQMESNVNVKRITIGILIKIPATI